MFKIFNAQDIFNMQTYIMFIMVLLIFLLYFTSKVSKKIKKIFIIISIIYNLIYLAWRALYTFPISFGIASSIISIILLAAEIMGFWQSFVFRLLFWKPYNNEELPKGSADYFPDVDIFIATYNEPIDILRKTIVGCINLNYPKEHFKVYLCDDGRRESAKRLCLELGINYMFRNDNLHAKAGNINNALKNTRGEFIMLLDADMVPKSNFLNKTIGYFLDERVGFVQTPQIFYNPDPFQFNLKFDEKIPNEQDFFMVDIQGGRANHNAVLHVGTNAVFRRKAIEDIGGIPTGTITEDMATGMLIQAKGYKTMFVKDVLCTGLSVESFRDLIKQRERWCRGNIQVTKKWNPLKTRGLTKIQKLIYFDGFIYWFFGIQKMIYILCPLIYLIFGTIILNAKALDLIKFWFPSFISSILTFRVLVNKTRSITWSHIYEIAMAPYIGMAALIELIFNKPIPFKVTPKGTSSYKTTFSFDIALPHIMLFVLTIIGWIFAIPKFLSFNMNVINSVFINIFWSVYNAIGIVISILVCFERPRKRTAERQELNEEVLLNITNKEIAVCNIRDISESGAKIECNGINNEYKDDNIEISMDNINKLQGKIVRANKAKEKYVFGIRFNDLTPEQYKKIVKAIHDKNKGYHKVN